VTNGKEWVEAGVTSLFYGAWIVRASDGMFVAELPDFPEITAVGVNQKQTAALGAAELLDGCVGRRGVAQLLEVREPKSRNVRD
jgi:hypothetical protein